MADDIVGVVQDQVARAEAERQAGHAAEPEHRQEGEREAHAVVSRWPAQSVTTSDVMNRTAPTRPWS